MTCLVVGRGGFSGAQGSRDWTLGFFDDVAMIDVRDAGGGVGVVPPPGC